MKTIKRLAVLALVFALVLPVFAGGSKEKATTEDGRPIITMWAPINPNITQVAQSFDQTAYWQELMERTGVQIEFEHASSSNDSVLTENFNILIASGDYPDIIQYKWIDYPGGPAAAIADGVIIPLNDVFEQYCPNITAFLESHPDIAKMISTDDGTYYCFPFLRGTSYENNNLLFSEGWVWRKDLLDKAGLDVPETPEDLYEALVAFKEMGIQIPLSIRRDHISRVLAPGFDSFGDSIQSFYVVDGVVHNGYVEENRKEYLKFANKLYEEGLLDNDYLSVDKNKLAVNVLNGLCGAAYAPGGSGIGTWLPAMRQSDPSVELVSARPISPEKGRLSMFAKMSDIYSNTGSSSAITTSCKDIETVARFLDFSYSEEGILLDNFGIEGKTYEMVDGYPKYTDKIVPTSEDGLTSEGYTISQALSMYTRTYATGGYIQDPRYLEQYYSLPELQEAINLWAQTDYGKYIYPPASTTAEEASELASIMNSINTYVDEMESRFITGISDIDAEWDGYVKQLKNFGIERAIEIKQEAYDRYMSK